MRWRRRNWPEREPRPEARTLLDEEKTMLLATLTKEVAASPVLMGLGLQVSLSGAGSTWSDRSARGTLVGSRHGGGSRRWPIRLTFCWNRKAARGAGPRSPGDRPENSSRPSPVTRRGRFTAWAHSIRCCDVRARVWNGFRSSGRG